MKRKILIIFQIVIFFLPVNAQVTNKESDLAREVTLYNPYKPSLADARKKSFLPEIIDTATVNPVFTYDVISKAYTPTYTISPIKAASLLSDPLPKLYKSYVKVGFGNNNTPLAELSITNLRSKSSAVGFYAKHYSSNGKVPLENDQRVFAGFMDNDVSLFGKKFFDKSSLDVSANFLQKVRYAYGYNTEELFNFNKEDIKLNYYDVGGAASYSSLNLDSTDLAYDFGLSYNYFHDTKERTMNYIGFSGAMSKLHKGFYIGGALEIDHYKLSDSIDLEPKYIMLLNPYIRKSTGQWNFNIGVRLAIEQNLTDSPKIYFYPDVKLGFSVVPEYMRFFAGLEGKLVNNEPLNIIQENPYMVPDGSIFRVPNTSHSVIISAGLKGNNGLGGNYLASVSYSAVNDMLFYSNVIYPDTVMKVERGNHFIFLPDDAEIFNIHGELTGLISDKMSFRASGNYYNYTLSRNESAWNKPKWDGKFGLSYNLRNKIIAGTELTAVGKRKLAISQSPTGYMTLVTSEIEEPLQLNLSLSAEYRYTKILSFWVKINNISWNRYYEWAYYPSQMFNFMVGFSYSL
jgi:hypothetical protein